MNSSLLGFVIGFFVSVAIADSAAAQGQHSSSLWDHNGSVVRLNADGAVREFYYEQPRHGLVQAGAKEGSLLFHGTTANGRYQGTAYIFKGSCGQFPYQVSGFVENDYKRVVLKGQAPRVGSDCKVRGYFEDTLLFSLVETGKPMPSSGSGFVFDEYGVTNLTDPAVYVRLNERVSPEALKQRFKTYKVAIRKGGDEGEDCYFCATITSLAGEFEVMWQQDKKTIFAIETRDERSVDRLGNKVGGSLANAIGGKTALCAHMEGIYCHSQVMKGFLYLAGGDNCQIEVEDDKPTAIPACATVQAFRVSVQ